MPPTSRMTGMPALVGVSLLSGVMALGGCLGAAQSTPGKGSDDGGTTKNTPTDLAPNAVAFEAVPASVYVARVKNQLTGLPANDDEVSQVEQDPAALQLLIEKWMGLPQFEGRMLDFFRNAFQQNQVTMDALQSSLGTGFNYNGGQVAPLLRNVMDSFGYTVWQLTQSGKPLNSAITTNQYMMTTAMMSLLSYYDDVNIDDTGKQTSNLYTRKAIPSFVADINGTATLAQTLNPNDPNYMHWTIPGTYTNCNLAPTALTINDGNNVYVELQNLLWGSINSYPACEANNGGMNFNTLFSPSDFTDWRMVTIQQTNTVAPDTTPVFWDILALRGANTMTLHTQRLGFFGTLAYDTNWPTNDSNEGRVTANQALIVSIGQSIDGENTIFNFPVNATDGDHASNPACAGCHSQLDPFKQYFRQSYTLTYHNQVDPMQISSTAGFAIDGITAKGQGVADVATTLANHPKFATAWTNKLYFWGTSTSALGTDPEFIRVATAFKTANYDFKTLVRELFSSPLVTLAGPTQTTTTNGIILSVERRDQFCAALSNRLGLPDVCGLTSASTTGQQQAVSSRAVLMATDTYYRAYALPSLPTDPDLFYRQSTEAVCGLVAGQVIDTTAGLWKSTDPTTAIADFVSLVMGVPPKDARAAAANAILTDNFTASRASGSNASDSLKATFTLACLAPSSVLQGM